MWKNNKETKGGKISKIFFRSFILCWYFYSFVVKFWSVICQLLDVLPLFKMNNRHTEQHKTIFIELFCREKKSDHWWKKTISDKWTPSRVRRAKGKWNSYNDREKKKERKSWAKESTKQSVSETRRNAAPSNTTCTSQIKNKKTWRVKNRIRCEKRKEMTKKSEDIRNERHEYLSSDAIATALISFSFN